jgi:hypothetical protein
LGLIIMATADDTTGPPESAARLQSILAGIDRDLAESAKLREEGFKLQWERLKLERSLLNLDATDSKLRAEARKYRFDPLMVLGGAIIAGLFLRLPEILHALGLGH